MADENCEESLVELYTYLDGALTDDRRVAIQRHLDDCPPCYETFDFEAELRMVIARKCQERVPDELRRKIAEVIGHEPPPARWPSGEPGAESLF